MKNDEPRLVIRDLGHGGQVRTPWGVPSAGRDRLPEFSKRIRSAPDDSDAGTPHRRLRNTTRYEDVL